MKVTELFTAQKELRALGSEIAKVAETEKRGLNAMEEKRLSDIESQVKSLDTQIDAELRAPMNTPNIPENRATPKLEKLTLRSVIEAMTLSNPELRAMASGGAGTPKMIEEILDIVAESNPMRGLASVYTLPGDGAVPVPGTATVAWAAEGATITPADVTVTPVQLSAFTLHGGITVNDATMMDDFYNVSKLLSQAAGGAIGEAEATAMFGNGAGASSPQGLFNGGTIVQTTTTATVVLADILNFMQSLETKWRRGREKLILSPSVLAAIINLKDATMKLEVDTRAGTIQGVPYVLTSLAPAYATTTLTKLMAYGDFKRGYAIAQRASDQGTIQSKVVPSAVAFASNVLFMERIDGRIVDGAAYKVWQVK